MSALLDALPFISAGVNPFLSVLGAATQTHSNEKINQQNVDMQRETNAQTLDMYNRGLAFQNEQREKQNDVNWRNAVDMFNMENEYNSPESQVKRYLAAGLNPMAAAKDAGLASGSAPSTSSSAGIGVPALTAPHQQMYNVASTQAVQNIAGLAAAVGSLSRGYADVAEGKKGFMTAPAILKNIEANTSNALADERGKQIANNLAEQFGVKEHQVQLWKDIQAYGNMRAQYEQMLAQKDYIEAETYLTQMKSVGQDIRNRMDNKTAARWDEYIDLDLKTGHQKIATMRSQEFEAWQHGNEYKALQNYYGVLSKGQQLSNELLKKENAFQDQTFNTRVMQFFDDANTHWYGSDRERVAFQEAQQNYEMAVKRNNKWEAQWWLDNAHTIANDACRIAGTVATRGMMGSMSNYYDTQSEPATHTYVEHGQTPQGYKYEKSYESKGHFENGRWVSH